MSNFEKSALANPPASILITEDMCVLSYMPTEKCPSEKQKKINAWNLNSVSKICSGPGIGELLVMDKCIDTGGSRIWKWL